MKIGFIGLGAMGSAMAANIAAAGHEVKGWNRSSRSIKGVTSVGSAADAFDGEVA